LVGILIAVLSRAPRSHPNALSDDVKSAILSIKKRFPYWGAVKISHRLGKDHSDWASYPCVSSISLFLKKEGLVCSRKRILRSTPTEAPLTKGRNVNDVWCADFKGHFKTGDGRRCNPLTMSDDVSRYLLCCRHLDNMTYDLVKMQFERVFREFGLPLVIRTDNGHPFSSHGLCGLSRLSAWWIRLGIHPERIEAGKPQQNGRHERIHLTLKNQTAAPAARSIELQQKRFDEFMQEYNYERPHEALDMKTPAEIYTGSTRQLPKKVGEVEYASGICA
jgi:transposase InsO family protein